MTFSLCDRGKIIIVVELLSSCSSYQLLLVVGSSRLVFGIEFWFFVMLGCWNPSFFVTMNSYLSAVLIAFRLVIRADDHLEWNT